MADLVRPVAVDTAVLTSTNAVAAEPAWLIGTTYAIGGLVNRNLNGQGRAWKSKVNANTGHDPATDDGTHWEDQGPTNPWLMFGDSATRQTTRADSLDVVMDLPATELSTIIWVENIAGNALRVVETDVGGEGVVFDQTFDLTDPAGITDPYAYSFEPIVRVTEFLVEGLFPFPGARIEVTISETGQTVGIGALVQGFPFSLGDTRWDLSLGIKDFTVFLEDAFGDETPVERPYKKTATFSTVMDNARVDAVITVLSRFRAVPVLIVADPGYAKSAVWGIATFKVDVPSPAACFCSLDVRSRAI